ncbi:hypothetical protein LWI29_015859 [Acer saccharum]|uniref:Uncharacterized protein n=1 Tax=Acer saccharum TaxID=4024 RepID=A0AA39SDT3_ACESA|nr:hypothetical protein LWI29_015859 [Acer saccharum]
MKLFCLAVNGAGSGHRSFGVWSPAPSEDFGRGGDNRLAVGSDSGDGSVRRSTVACVGFDCAAAGSDGAGWTEVTEAGGVGAAAGSVVRVQLLCPS